MDAPAGGPDNQLEPAPAVITSSERVMALVEVLICSDYPTQLALGSTFAAFGFRPVADALTIGYVAALSLADSVFLVGLILFFLWARGERPRDVLFGRRPIVSEAWAGVPLAFVAVAITIAVLLTLQTFAPWLHTVSRNPLQDLVQTPRDAALFVVVLIVAGGVREEVQRAFLLRRFEQWLGGPRVGLVVSSLLFGTGHFLQGADAAVTTALLGAFWGAVYLRRRSIAATVVSHAGFNLVQVLQYLSVVP
jgi:membrane protease YdiL (CAAX protease family)